MHQLILGQATYRPELALAKATSQAAESAAGRAYQLIYWQGGAELLAIGSACNDALRYLATEAEALEMPATEAEQLQAKAIEQARIAYGALTRHAADATEATRAAALAAMQTTSRLACEAWSAMDALALAAHHATSDT